MSKFEDLIKDKVVADHPLLKGYRDLPKLREVLEKHAETLTKRGEDLSDMFSKKPPKSEQPKDMRSIIYKASEVLGEVLAQFDFPMIPKVNFNCTRDVKYAKHDDTQVIDAVIYFTAHMLSKTGIRKDAEIPIPVVSGEVTIPSIMEVDGRPMVISQHAIDEVLGRLTSYAVPQLREHEFSLPLERSEREVRVEIRNTMGPQAVENKPELYLNQKLGAEKQAVKMTPAGFEQVVELLEAAQESGEDTFPRTYGHVLRHYVLEVVNTAEKDKWEKHLINRGFCLNPWGKATTSRHAAYDEFSEVSNLVNMIVGDEWMWENVQDVIIENAAHDYAAIGEHLHRVIGSPDQSDDLWFEVAKDLSYIMLGLEEEGQIKGSKDAQTLMPGVEDFFDNEDGMEKDMEFEVSDIPESVWDRMYPGTRTPIEVNDSVKFPGSGSSNSRGMIVDIDPEKDFLIIKSRGMEYRVEVDSVEPLPSTFKKMYE